MPYPIIELELTQPLPALSTGPMETGLAVILRCDDRPVGFALRSQPPNTTISAGQVTEWVNQIVADKLLQDKIYDQIPPPPPGIDFPSLTVAICTKDRPDNLKRCLASLVELQNPAAPAFEILVIDNASSDSRTRDLVKTWPSVRYGQEPKPGLDFARNHALGAATGELLAFLDDDVTVDRRWLQGLQTAFNDHPDAGGFTGLVLPYELETEAQILFEQRGGFRRGFEKIRYGQRLSGNSLYPCGAGIFGAGCNMAFRRSLLLELGGFDDALDTGGPMPGGGDLDIFYRVVRAGYPLIYEPSYLVYHQHRRELNQLRRQYWSWGLGFMAFLVKSYQHDPAMRRRIIRLVGWWFKYQLRMLKRSLTGAHTLPAGMVLAEIWGGLMGGLGGYPRSRQRVEAIRQRVEASQGQAILGSAVSGVKP